MKQDNGAVARKEKQANAGVIAKDFDASHPRVRPTSLRAIPVGADAEIAFVHEINLSGLAQSVELPADKLNSRSTQVIGVIPYMALEGLIQQLMACQNTLQNHPANQKGLVSGKPRLVTADGSDFIGGKT